MLGQFGVNVGENGVYVGVENYVENTEKKSQLMNKDSMESMHKKSKYLSHNIQSQKTY